MSEDESVDLSGGAEVGDEVRIIRCFKEYKDCSIHPKTGILKEIGGDRAEKYRVSWTGCDMYRVYQIAKTVGGIAVGDRVRVVECCKGGTRWNICQDIEGRTGVVVKFVAKYGGDDAYWVELDHRVTAVSVHRVVRLLEEAAEDGEPEAESVGEAEALEGVVDASEADGTGTDTAGGMEDGSEWAVGSPGPILGWDEPVAGTWTYGDGDSTAAAETIRNCITWGQGTYRYSYDTGGNMNDVTVTLTPREAAESVPALTSRLMQEYQQASNDKHTYQLMAEAAQDWMDSIKRIAETAGAEIDWNDPEDD